MPKLTPHFESEEWDLPHEKAERYGLSGAPYPEEWLESRLLPLAQALEIVRATLDDRTIRIISGYRPEEYNRAIGGATLSQHVQGRAADIVVDGVDATQVYRSIRALHRAGKIRIGGLGVYDSFVHVDTRPGGFALWDERSKKPG